MISGERIRQARELSALTQIELAERVGVSQSYIAQVEGGYKQPPEQLVHAIALKTGFPLAFFRQEPPVDFPLGSLLYRAHASVPSREKFQAYRYAQILFEMFERKLGTRLNLPPVKLSQLSGDPTVAARATRAALGLSVDTPIPHLLNAIEKAGVLVFTLPIELEEVDAFSLWAGTESQRPTIALSAGKPGDRLRMSAAHDLGHLVMHRGVPAPLDAIEREANQFAAELLMPEIAMHQEILRPVTLTGLAEMKPRWGVSIQALIKRAHELQLITQRQYKYLYEQLGAMGWRTHEPIATPVEKPRALRQMAEIIYGTPINYERFASDTALSVRFLKRLMEAYADKALPSEARKDDSPEAPTNLIRLADRRKSRS